MITIIHLHLAVIGCQWVTKAMDLRSRMAAGRTAVGMNV
jgi:hypothetical protein